MSEQYVTLKSLAEEFGLDRSNMRKYTLASGFEPIRIRTPESRGQLTLALTMGDAEALRELRSNQGFGCTSKPIDNGKGWFYIIQLIPDLDPKRVKLGFASNIDARLQAHRTAAPTAELVKAWPCKKTWEQAAIDSITRNGCILIANEVFNCDTLDHLVDRADAFFQNMPTF